MKIPPTVANQSTIEIATRNYFDTLEEDPKLVPTIAGLAFFLDFSSRNTLINFSKSEHDLAPFVKRAILQIEVEMENRLVQGNQNVTGVIFALKNNYGWKDKSEVKQKVTTNVTLGDLFDKTKRISDKEE